MNVILKFYIVFKIFKSLGALYINNISVLQHRHRYVNYNL